MKIAFFVSDLSNVFHQGQAAEAQKYGKEKYGAEVFVFDGKADSAVMTQNVDQIMALMREGLSYKVVGGVRFYERKEIKDALAYMRLVINPHDDVSLRRVINVPARGIGNSSDASYWSA